MKWKYISSLKTRIYPKWFPNASTVTWSLILQTRNLANKIEEFWKCDDFSGEISSVVVACTMYNEINEEKHKLVHKINRSLEWKSNPRIYGNTASIKGTMMLTTKPNPLLQK
jgi:hypothetical protein